VCSSSLSGTIDPSTSDNRHIEYGKDFHSVVRICGTYNDGTMYCASAVLIDDHHILTAAHVVNNSKTCNITIGEKKYPISNITINKDFDKEFAVGDIAIGYSEESFDLDYYPPLYEGNDEIGKICSISGYGLTGTFLTGAKKSDDKKRAGSNMVDHAFKDVLLCTPSRRNEKGYTDLEFCIASGDSGGGLFIDGKLAGINSFIMAGKGSSPNGKYGEEACHTRISKFITWIKDNRYKK
jgi:TATA-box binding protein (TBP) (component of TFIID and TFIIIB)